MLTLHVELSMGSWLYKSLILPMLDYCSSLWDPHQAYLINKLESVQWLLELFLTDGRTPILTFCRSLVGLLLKREGQN